jgi:hypothetical protein
MALNEDWVQSLLKYEATLEAPGDATDGSDSGEIGRAWIDGVLVVYDLQDVPAWLAVALDARDEDGNTALDRPRVAVG